MSGEHDPQLEINADPNPRPEDALGQALARARACQTGAAQPAAPPSDAPPGADAPSDAAIRARARQMLDEMGPEGAAGFRDLQNLALAVGLPATRAVFRQMIAASHRGSRVKLDAVRAVREFSPVTEVGCLKVDFYNTATGAPDAAYLVLDQCPKAHDLGAQLRKLQSVVAEPKWPEVLKHLSALVQFGRSVYGSTARQHLPLIRRLFGLGDDDRCEKYLDLQIDRANTTLYVDADWADRVGIFVRLEAEIAAENSK